MKVHIKAPIVLIAFNRPDTTKIAFESIREVQPEKLYVVIDGPREHKPGEAELCKEVLEITKDIDWDCDVKYLVREENLGCKLGVTGAISWVLKEEESVIVIEDDIIAVPAFFEFAQTMLEKYKNDERIAMVSANNYTPMNTIEEDYLFSKHGHIWGWATWKRAWDHFDVNVPEIQNVFDENHHKIEFASSTEKHFYKRYFKNIAANIKNGNQNTWGPQFVFHRVYHNLLSIVPSENLASNIGENSSRTEDNNSKALEHYYPSSTNFHLKNHPNSVVWNREYDMFHFKNHIDKISFLGKLKYKIKNIKTIK
jgi:hypothetical protein